VTYLIFGRGFDFCSLETEPLALWAVWWHISVQVLVLRLYAIGAPLFSPTTFASKFTIRSPVIFGEVAPIPWAVWHTEQVKPYWDMCRLCCVKLELDRIWVKP